MSLRPVRIAQVATADFSVRSLLSGQIRALQQRGALVTALCNPGHAVPDLERMGIPVVGVPMKRRLSPLQDLASLWRLRRAFKAGRYDAVITHTPKAGLIGPVAARLAGVRAIIHTVHGLLFHEHTPPGLARLFQAAEQWTALWTDWLFFQSREDLETVRRLHMAPAEHLYYIGNGIDLKRFDPAAAGSRDAKRRELGLEPDDFVVGTVSRLVYEKGVGEFLDAAEMLLPTFPQMRFLVVGPAEPERPDAIPPERIRSLAETGRFVFTGRRRDMPELYSAMDLFVLASHREGVPRAVMEAGAMGLPVVATRIRGCREIVRDGVTGLLIPVRSAPDVAVAIASIANDGCGPQMGAAGQAIVRAFFDEELVNRRIADALEEILGRPLGSHANQG